MSLSSHRSFVALSIAWACQWTWSAELAAAQEAEAPAAPAPLESSAPDAGPPAAPSDSPDGGVAPPPSDADAAVAPEAEPEQVAAPVEPPRGDTPVSVEAIVNPDAVGVAPQPPAATEPPPPPPAASGPKPKEPKEPQKPQETKPKEPPPPEQPAQPPQGPLVVWTTAGWAHAFGPATCGPHGLEGSEIAIKIASTLHRSAAVAGLAVAAAGALGDHPLFAYAAKEQPEALADLIAAAGFDALAVGIADVNGPLFREPRLSTELHKRGIAIIASNLECGGQAFCETWQTAEDPLPILQKHGRRYAFISLLPDDTLGRVQPSAGRRFELHSAADTLVALTTLARQQGAELIVGSIDHGPDASVNLANFVGPMPPEVRPDLLLSPSAADNLLFLRPLDVQPAIVGTRPSVLMGLRVTKIADTTDTDVFARSVKLNDRDESFLARARSLGASYCASRAAALPGGHIDAPMTSADLVQLAGNAVRQVANTDLAVVDPLVYDPTFSQPQPGTLQRGQIERAVQLDSPLVTASVALDWLANLNKLLDSVRPLSLIGTGIDRGDAIIAGRIPVVGARYTIVTSAVLARSGRLPDGASWTVIGEPSATVRGALLRHLAEPSQIDPRYRVRDPAMGTQWVFRSDGQVQANLTAVDNPTTIDDEQVYNEPGLKVNDSKQLGFRLLLNMDGDAPKFLFENALQIAFDRNFTTNTTAQDQVFLETTYTYRGLWPQPLLYPHPFVEGYLETEFDQGNAPYHHLLVRPEAGFRSMVSRVLSLKLSAGFQYEVLQPDSQIYPGVGAEIVLKPTTVAPSNGTLQLESNVIYYWNAPGELDQHTLRGQVISALTIAGPLQLTLTALGVLSKYKDVPFGKGFSLQAGIRLRFVDRSLNN